VIPAAHARAALEALGALQGDATLDIAEGTGHAIHPALVQRALFRLRNHIPARTWAAALGAVPRPAQDNDD
jgi:phospholipase/carboxylesterase